jgi:peptidyl-prolyl cis-trans isomerase SurA
MRQFGSAIFLFAVIFLGGFAAFGQETEERVIDEVVAQVNDGVITLSRVKREIKGIVDAEVQQGKKREDVEKAMNEKRGELIASLINEELIIQKAKDLNMDSEVEASVNRRFAELMKQNNLKTLEALYAEMEKAGADPQEIRDLWRKQATREMVLQREVQSKLYWQAGNKEIKDYYEKNKARFTKPETVSVSEIFLGFAGRDESAVREKAKQLVAKIRAGGDFAKLAAENSDPGVVTQGTGSTKLKTSELSEKLVTALKGVKVGAVTDPVEADQLGIVILKVDAREQASSESFFDESAVRVAIMAEKIPEEQKKFMATLRSESYIKISEAYRPMVAPILFADERKDKVANK